MILYLLYVLDAIAGYYFKVSHFLSVLPLFHERIVILGGYKSPTISPSFVFDINPVSRVKHDVPVFNLQRYKIFFYLVQVNVKFMSFLQF